jgi:hypothetical protein
VGQALDAAFENIGKCSGAFCIMECQLIFTLQQKLFQESPTLLHIYVKKELLL